MMKWTELQTHYGGIIINTDVILHNLQIQLNVLNLKLIKFLENKSKS